MMFTEFRVLTSIQRVPEQSKANSLSCARRSRASFQRRLQLLRPNAWPREGLLRILIVDDHELVRRGVRSLLLNRADVDICGEATDGQEAIEKAQELRPDIIVMDISMPRVNGLEATRIIVQVLPHTKIIMLSQHDIPAMMKNAFSVGAHAYVVKSAISDQLITALETVQRGQILPHDIHASTEANVDVQEILQRSAVFERALRETEERLRLAQQVARVGTFELNVKTGVNLWTPELEALYGLRPGAFSGTYSAWELLVHPEDRHATFTAFESAPKGQVFEGEWRVIWPDSSVHWLLGRAWLFSDSEGKPERWVGVNIDITERKRAEAEAQKLLRLLDLSFDAIVLRDVRDRVRYWNRGAQDLYGWTPEEAFGKVTHSLLQTAFPEPLEKIFAVLRTEGRWEGQLTHSAKDGRRVTVLSRWGLFQDWESGEPWVMETNTHIMQRKAQEAEQLLPPPSMTAANLS
jgi:PAS domain S-box-containing protein